MILIYLKEFSPVLCPNSANGAYKVTEMLTKLSAYVNGTLLHMQWTKTAIIPTIFTFSAIYMYVILLSLLVFAYD